MELSRRGLFGSMLGLPLLALPVQAEVQEPQAKYGVCLGKVKWYDPEKGYGFFTSEVGDILVHVTALRASGFRTLKEGERYRVHWRHRQKKLTPFVFMLEAA